MPNIITSAILDKHYNSEILYARINSIHTGHYHEKLNKDTLPKFLVGKDIKTLESEIHIIEKGNYIESYEFLDECEGSFKHRAESLKNYLDLCRALKKSLEENQNP